jgi:hypothetical protein
VRESSIWRKGLISQNITVAQQSLQKQIKSGPESVAKQERRKNPYKKVRLGELRKLNPCQLLNHEIKVHLKEWV